MMLGKSHHACVPESKLVRYERPSAGVTDSFLSPIRPQAKFLNSTIGAGAWHSRLRILRFSVVVDGSSASAMSSSPTSSEVAGDFFLAAACTYQVLQFINQRVFMVAMYTAR